MYTQPFKHVLKVKHNMAVLIEVRVIAGMPPPPPEVWVALRIAVAHRSKTAFVIKIIIYKEAIFVQVIFINKQFCKNDYL